VPFEELPPSSYSSQPTVSEATVPRLYIHVLYIYMTASVMHWISVVQVFYLQLIRNLSLPRYLKKWFREKAGFPVSY
jgi:hypothetical protein